MPEFLLQVDESNLLYSKLSQMENYGWGEFGRTEDVSHSDDKHSDDLFGIHPFYIKKGDDMIPFYSYVV